ncbi:MAG: hypothetical protein BGO90_15105 [Legionella sp. 40-6]|nr:MAG: hypothetical protein BGO90_15105 [Legionella sp. 40-6]
MVEEYRQIHHADPNLIAMGYARTGNNNKAEEYRLRYLADPSSIAMGYALAGNHSKVEEYRKLHAASLKAIAQGYQRAHESIPRLYQAILILIKHGPAGHAVIEAISRLLYGKDKQWNPYWINADLKLELIIRAVEELKFSDNIGELLNNPKSELYRALDMYRMALMSLGKWFGLKHTRSFMLVRSLLSSPKMQLHHHRPKQHRVSSKNSI